jgi:Flp pilus assembly protein TadG
LEFLVVLPALLFIFLGGLELSRAWFTATIATNAAREGARIAAALDPVDPANPSFTNAQTAGQQRIDDVLTAANLTAASRSVTCDNAGGPNCATNSQVTATLTINFVTVTPLFLPMLGTSSSPLVITETVNMRRE